MAENTKGSSYEHFSRAWHILLPVGCGLFWLGSHVLSLDQVDDRVSSGVKPLQDRTEWLAAEIRRHEGRGHPGTDEEIRALEERVRLLEGRR